MMRRTRRVLKAIHEDWNAVGQHQPGIAFPQGSIALKARAGSDPKHETTGVTSGGFRGRRSFDRKGVAPSRTLRPEAESAVREYASEP